MFWGHKQFLSADKSEYITNWVALPIRTKWTGASSFPIDSLSTFDYNSSEIQTDKCLCVVKN